MGTFSGRRIKGSTLCLTIIAVVMAHAQWIQTTHKELPSNSPWHQYRIEGKFLTPPRSPSSPPAFIVECQAGDRSPLSDRDGGNFDRARITFGGAIINQIPYGAAVASRRDGDHTDHVELWSTSPDGTSVLLSYESTIEVLYRHFQPQPWTKSVPVKTLRITAEEYLAAKVIAEFQLPDPSSLANECGFIVH